jgi:hypothetical protein
MIIRLAVSMFALSLLGMAVSLSAADSQQNLDTGVAIVTLR